MTTDPGITPIDPAGEATLRQRLSAFNPWWLAIAATLFLALWIWREFAIRVARENAKSQAAEIMRLETANDNLVRQLEKAGAELSGLASAHVVTVTLAPQPAAPAASGKVFLDKPERRAIAFFYGLPMTQPGKQYRVWLVGGAGPAEAEAFSVPRSGRASVVVENIPPDLKTFAVALDNPEQPALSGDVPAQ